LIDLIERGLESCDPIDDSVRGCIAVCPFPAIVHRPEEVAGRLLPGHWEGDFIKGAYNRSGVGTLVERKTRFVVLRRMDGCTAADALEGFTRQMKKLPAFLRESLTYDRGSEMACHAALAQRLNIDIWFADPYAPWQRGSNENTNGSYVSFCPKAQTYRRSARHNSTTSRSCSTADPAKRSAGIRLTR